MRIAMIETSGARRRGALLLVAVIAAVLVAGNIAAWQAPVEPAGEPAVATDEAAPQPAVRAPANEPPLPLGPVPAAERPTPLEPIQAAPIQAAPIQAAPMPVPVPSDVPMPAADSGELRSIVRPAQPFDPTRANPTRANPTRANPTRADAPPEEPAIAPVPQAADEKHIELDPANFKGIQPGKSTLADLAKTWGAPIKGVTENGTTFNTYQFEPFKQVDVSLKGDTVVSIVVTLKKPTAAAVLAGQLNYDATGAALVTDDRGQPLGQAFPEHGVLFLFAPAGVEKHSVAQVIVETPTAVAFFTRARGRRSGQYSASLADLDFALRMDPRLASAHALRASVLLAIGRLDEARAAIDEALRITPDNFEYQLSRAKVMQEAGQFQQAGKAIESLLAVANFPAPLKAQALCRQGDLLARTPRGDFAAAIKNHLEAIKTAQPLAQSQQIKIRRIGKRVLVEAHLGVARDIAWGDWKEKQRVVPKWLNRASAYVENLIEKDQGDEQLRLAVMQTALSACVATKAQFDPSPWTGDALAVSRKMIADATDPLHRQRIQWLLANMLHEAVRIAHAQGKYDQALQLGSLAVEQFEKGTAGRKPTPQLLQAEGRLHYRIGLVYAVGRNDHAQAVKWYERAISLLEGQVPQSANVDAAARGEILVSVGVSYWKTGQQQKALRLTDQGRELMEIAVAAGLLERASLGIPYANLSFMHRGLGQKSPADNYLQLARQVKVTDAPKQR
ncbi:MAG: tetratricopeptide repeat protein [Planctomycetes bacterium]|nr:tetratricopeptide repeat protein [Planctomycetota bacterium]